MAQIIKPLRSGQITIPASFRQRLGIDADSLLQITLENGELHIKPVRVNAHQGSPWLKDLYNYFAPVRQEAVKRGYSEKQINEWVDKAVTEVRKRHKKHV